MKLAALILLSALWGGAFIFTRVAAPAFGPVLLIWFRVLLSGLILLGYVLATRGRPRFRVHWRHHLTVGVINSVLPFVLIATAVLNLPASLASILNATTTLFAAIFAGFMNAERFTARKVAGLAIGFVGVIVAIGLAPIALTPRVLMSCALSLGAAVCYAFFPNYMQAYASEEDPHVLAMSSLFFSGLVLLPAVPFTLPHQFPSSVAIGNAVALAVLGTAAAFLLFFWLIAETGPVYASMNSYLVPVFGSLWAALFLHEKLSLGTMIGFGVILASVVLVSEASPRRRVTTRPGAVTSPREVG
ncbi:MAG: DMT family transporter [Bacillota bacterium]